MRGGTPRVEWDNDKPTVVALREIAEGHTDFDVPTPEEAEAAAMLLSLNAVSEEKNKEAAELASVQNVIVTLEEKATPAEIKSAETKPAETKPAEAAAPTEATPEETKPAEATAPTEATPEETKPAEATAPTEATPEEAKPAEATAPTEATPEETCFV